MSKNVGKNISKNVSGKYSPGMLAIRQKLLNHAKQPATNALKILQREQYKKQQKRLVIWLVINLLIKLQGFKKIHNRVI